jgi:transcription antitermination factor NusG
MHWYLIYTHSWHEKKVKKRLERERLETFLPVTERWSRRQDRRERITLPLLPGYLFVRTEMNATIYLKILRIKGVIGFFCNGGKPAAIPDEEMDTIQRDFRKSHKSLQSLFEICVIKRAKGSFFQISQKLFLTNYGFLYKLSLLDNRLLLETGDFKGEFDQKK